MPGGRLEWRPIDSDSDDECLPKRIVRTKAAAAVDSCPAAAKESALYSRPTYYSAGRSDSVEPL